MLATIGYESASLEDFITTLGLGGVEILIDIRDRAQSRRKGFSKSALSEALAESGIDYVHYRELGDPKEGREAARDGRFEDFRKIFSKVMATKEAQDALSAIEEMAKEKRVCLMCYERDQRTCHRKIVADHLEAVLECRTNHLGVRHGVARQKVAA